MAVAVLATQDVPLTNIKTLRVQLTAGAFVVAFPGLTDNTQIFVSPDGAGITGFLTVSSRTTGTGFTVTSSVGGDTGFVDIMLVLRQS